MSRWQKTVTTIWTTLLASPLLVFLVAYFRLECGELDPCPTGGAMPYAPLAFVLLVAIAGGQLAFLVMIWRSAPGENWDG
jgi:hypothetical protein